MISLGLDFVQHWQLCLEETVMLSALLGACHGRVTCKQHNPKQQQHALHLWHQHLSPRQVKALRCAVYGI